MDGTLGQNLSQSSIGSVARTLIITGLNRASWSPSEPSRADRSQSTRIQGIKTENGDEAMTNSEGKRRSGFASMTSEKQREIASKGGRAAHVKGTAHEWTPEEARSAGRKGAQASRYGRGQPAEMTLESRPAMPADMTPESQSAISGEMTLDGAR